MSALDQVIAAIVIATAGAAAGWYAKSVKVERDELRGELVQERDARQALANDVRTGNQASAGFQQQLQRINAALSTMSKEANHALQAPVACADGASAVALGDVPVPAVLVDRLRDAGADRPADPASAR